MSFLDRIGEDAMNTSITANAKEKIARFNAEGLHYNIIANEIYNKHNYIDPFDKSFLEYVIAGLTVFDLGPRMGSNKYDFERGFASRLDSKLREIKQLLEPLMKLSLPQIPLQEYYDAMMTAYNTLAARGPNALHEDQTRAFHVGATKILHFLNPHLFIIVDRHASRAFRIFRNIPFRNTTQPGYSAKRYFECMQKAQEDISAYGLEQFKALEPDIPITRIYDKLTFVTGKYYEDV